MFNKIEAEEIAVFNNSPPPLGSLGLQDRSPGHLLGNRPILISHHPPPGPCYPPSTAQGNRPATLTHPSPKPRRTKGAHLLHAHPSHALLPLSSSSISNTLSVAQLIPTPSTQPYVTSPCSLGAEPQVGAVCLHFHLSAPLAAPSASPQGRVSAPAALWLPLHFCFLLRAKSQPPPDTSAFAFVP